MEAPTTQKEKVSSPSSGGGRQPVAIIGTLKKT